MTSPARLCANCVERPATHRGSVERGGPVFDLCDDCELPAVEGHGIERGYEPSGGLLSLPKASAGASRAMGEGRYERDSDMNKVLGQKPVPARDPSMAELIDHDYETRRRNRTGANKTNVGSRRGRPVW